MTWAEWLAAPIGASMLAAVWVWWRNWRVRRAARPLSTEASVRAQAAYLDALASRPRSAARPAPTDDLSGVPSTLPR